MAYLKVRSHSKDYTITSEAQSELNQGEVKMTREHSIRRSKQRNWFRLILTLVVALGTTLGTATTATSKAKAPDCTAPVTKNGCYWYVRTNQRFDNSRQIGAFGTFSVHKPHVNTNDDHSLAEIVVATKTGTNTENAVEAGWVVSPSLFAGSTDPHLFVLATNGTQNQFCWGLRARFFNCHWHEVSSRYRPNTLQTVAPGSNGTFRIERRNDGNWWVGYNGVWMGYYDAGFWNNRFQGFQTAQWYGEVQTFSDAHGDCTQMGNGLYGTQPGAAHISNMGIIHPRGRYTRSIFVSDPGLYNTGSRPNPNNFTYGGPGNLGNCSD